MPTLAPTAVLGARYTARQLLGERAGAQTWAGSDGTTGADVILHVLPSSNPQAPAVLDAARRCSGLDSPRLVRILDAGTDGTHVYFVEEAVPGGQTLGQLAGRGGLDASEVRRLTGEAALALDAAQRRGLHHLFLTPDSLIRSRDGSVKIAGLATEAALAGQDHIGGPRALRRDAQGLVALAYAGLTGRWPHGSDTGLEPAPRFFGGVPRPSEIAVGVPADLDTLCRQTLNEGLGPSSPGDYAAQIAPWAGPAGSALGPGVIGEPDSPPSDGQDAEVATTIPRAGLDRSRRQPEPDAHDAPTAPLLATDPEASSPGGVPDRSGTEETDPGAVAPARADVGATAPRQAPDAVAERDGARDPAGSGIDGETEAEDRITSEADTPGETDRAGDPEPGIASEVIRAGGAVGRTGSRAAAAKGVIAGRAGAARAAVSARVGGLTRAATSRAGESLTERRTLKAAMRDEEDRSRVGIEQTRRESGYEAPAPLLPAEAGAPPSPAQRRLVLALFAVVVAVAGFLAAVGVGKIGSRTDLESILGGTSAKPQPTVRSSPRTSSPGSGQVLAIVAAEGYDPQGNDSSENDDLAPRVYDGDPTTYWQTEGYQGPRFSGLKTGVGLVLDMGQVVTPREATLLLPSSSTVELYVNDLPGLTDATKIGSAAGGGSGRPEVVIHASEQASGQYVIVWFTDAPQQGTDGRYRASLAEIVVKG